MPVEGSSNVGNPKYNLFLALNGSPSSDRVNLYKEKLLPSPHSPLPPSWKILMAYKLVIVLTFTLYGTFHKDRVSVSILTEAGVERAMERSHVRPFLRFPALSVVVFFLAIWKVIF